MIIIYDIGEVIANELLGINDWFKISNSELTDELIIDYANKLNLRLTSRHNHIPAEALKKVLQVGPCQDIGYILQKSNYSIEELDVFAQYISIDVWSSLCLIYKPEEWFIDKYIEHIDFETLYCGHKYDEGFIKKYTQYYNEFVWEAVSRQTISKEFIEEFKDKLCWNLLIEYTSFDFDFFEKYVIYFNDKAWYSISDSARFNLSNDFINKYSKHINFNAYLNSFHRLDEDLIEKYIKHIDLSIITDNQDFSEEFLIRHHKKLDYNLLLDNYLLKDKLKRLKGKVKFRCQ